MTGQDFERSLVNCFNSYFVATGTRALAYRNKQHRYTEQVFDIFIDSKDPLWYMAIECKSIDARSTHKLYYSTHFHNTAKFPQIQREIEHLRLTGRLGLLAVEARRGPGKKTACWLVPWPVLEHSYKVGEPGLIPEQITYSVCLTKLNKAYQLDDVKVKDLATKLLPASQARKVKLSWRSKK